MEQKKPFPGDPSAPSRHPEAFVAAAGEVVQARGERAVCRAVQQRSQS